MWRSSSVPSPSRSSCACAGRCARIALARRAEHFVDDRAAIGGARRHRDGVERVELENMARENRIGIAHQDLDFGDAEIAREQSRVGLRSRARQRRRGLRRVERAGKAAIVVAGPSCGSHASFRKSLEALQEARGTMGDPSRFCARVITTSCVPSACTKSCAVWPMRRSGGIRPTRARMGRLRNASVTVRGGHVPSSNPPSTTRSTDKKRASSNPRISGGDGWSAARGSDSAAWRAR